MYRNVKNDTAPTKKPSQFEFPAEDIFIPSAWASSSHLPNNNNNKKKKQQQHQQKVE